MATIEELVVKAKPEGLSQTSSGFNQMQEELEETEQQMEDTTSELSGMAQKWRGVMGVVVAGLATAVAGVLSQVPIVGEVMGRFGMILDAIIYKIDKDLRPSLTKFNSRLDKVIANVWEANSAVEAIDTAIRGVRKAIDGFAISVLQNKIKELTGITIPENWLNFGWQVITMDARGAFNAAKKIIKNFTRDAIKFLNNFETKSGKKMGNLVSGMLKDLAKLPTQGVSYLKDLWAGFKNWLKKSLNEVQDFANNASNAFTDLVSKAVGWGVDLIKNFIDGVTNAAGDISGFFSDLASGDFKAVGEAVVNLSGGGGGGGGGSNRGFRAGSSTAQIYMDGRELTSNTGRYRRDATSRRGRHG